MDVNRTGGVNYDPVRFPISRQRIGGETERFKEELTTTLLFWYNIEKNILYDWI